MCPACGTTHTCTVAGEAAWNQRAAIGSSGLAAAGDDQHRPGGGGADGVWDAHRAGGAAEQPGRGVLHPFHTALQDAVDAVRQPAVVGELLARRALGDHGADLRVLAHGGEGLLAAHRLAHQRDLAGVDAGLAGQERHGGGDVAVTPPAEVHRMPAGQAMAAAVQQQRPVAVPGQHRRLPEHRGAGGPRAGQHQRGGAVARRDVPAQQPHPIGGAEGHSLVGEPVLGGRGRSQRPRWDVGRVDRHGQREQHQPQQRQCRRDGQQPPPARHRPDQRGGPPDQQEEAGHQHNGRQHRGRVQARLRKVPAGHTRSGRRAHDAQHQRRRPPANAPGPAGEPDRRAGHRQRHQDPHHPPHR